MKILYSNAVLENRTGTEIVTVETTERLSTRGHDVCVYTLRAGQIADELATRGIAVITDLSQLPWWPDIVHSNHLPTSIDCALGLPSKPQVFICHDATNWHSAPPALSLITRWLTVDVICSERIRRDVPNCGEIIWLPNAVNLDQFKLRPPLPARPSRVAAIVRETSYLHALDEACARKELSLDVFGAPVDRVVDDLPLRLQQYDIVIASGRSALEAMATGCSVIVADQRGLAGLVTSEVVQKWRRDNFGSRTMTRTLTAEDLAAELSRYDAADAQRVTSFIRRDANLEDYITRLEEVYRDAIAEFRPVPFEVTAVESKTALLSTIVATLRNFLGTNAPPLETPCRAATLIDIVELINALASESPRFQGRLQVLKQLASLTLARWRQAKL